MRKALKILGFLLGLLVLLVVALAIAVPLLFDINDHKDRIAAEVEAATGRVLTIEGDLELTVFPWLGVRSGAMSLAQADGFGDEAFAAFSEAEVRVRLVPLVLRREVEIGRIALRGLRVNLEVDADGRDNWSDMAGTDVPVEDLPDETPPRDPAGELEKLRVEGFVLADARLSFRDAQAGTVYTIESLDLTTGEIRIGQPLRVEMRAEFSSAVPQAGGSLDYEGVIDFDPDAGQVSLEIERLAADLTGGVLPFDRVRATVAGRLTADLGAERYTVEGLGVDAVVRGGMLPDADHAMQLEAGAHVDLAAQTLEFGPVRFQGLGVGAELSGTGTRILDAPLVSGRLTVGAFSPRTIAGDLGIELPETADPRVLRHLQFSGEFEAGETAAAVEGLSLRIDDTTVSGRVAIADFDTQALRFELAVDTIDVDRYLPPVDDEADEDAAPTDLDAIEFPVELDDLLRDLDLDGTVRIGNMTAAGLRSEDIRMTARSSGGVLRIHPAAARMYGGTYSGDITVDVRSGTPRISMDERMNGIQSGALFDDLFDTDRITGVAAFTAQLTAQGRTIGQMRRTLDGRVTFGFQDGAVQGFDLWHMLRDARAVLRQETRPQKTGPAETPFGSLSGSGKVESGVMRNDDLTAELPFMRVAGRGSIDLAEETLDYRLETTVLDRPGVDAEGMGELKGRTIPVKITGPFDDLSFSVDLASVLKDEVQDRVEDRLRDAIRRRFER